MSADPDDRDQGRSYWLIKFEDPDRPDELFTDERAARATLEQHLNQWACHLFVHVSRAEAAEAQVAALKAALKDAKERYRGRMGAVRSLRKARDEAWIERDRLRAQVAEAERARDRAYHFHDKNLTECCRHVITQRAPNGEVYDASCQCEDLAVAQRRVEELEKALRRNLPAIRMYANLDDCEAAEAALQPREVKP
jgi:hypothetical protein